MALALLRRHNILRGGHTVHCFLMGEFLVCELRLQGFCVRVPVDLLILELLKSALKAIDHILRPELVVLASAL